MNFKAIIERGNIRKAFVFLPNFAAAKASIYFIPIAIAAFASAQIYGAIELSQSVGLLIAAIIVGAPLAGITQLHLVRNRHDVVDQIWTVNAAGCALSLIATVLAWTLGARLDMILVCAAFGAAATHNCASSSGRMFGKRNLTAWADGTAMIVAAVAVAITILITGEQSLSALILVYVGLTVISLLASLTAIFVKLQPGLASRLTEAFRIGMPMVLFGIVSMWLGVGGRITVGFLVPGDLAAYGVAFRIAGLTLGIHQLLQTALFAKVYKARTRQADRLTAPFLAGVCVLALAVSLAGGFVVGQFRLASLTGDGMATFRSILPIVSIQVFFWIATAMLQVRINRSRLSQRAILPILIVTLTGAAAMVLAVKLGLVGIVGLSWLIALHAATYFATSWTLLVRKGLVHRWIGTVGAAGGGLLALAAVLHT
ncbi:MAG: hypothetical protein KDE55_13640 [Novosphingobium sp.]|nr:hypothetical protein [Novosphingobium sp.]